MTDARTPEFFNRISETHLPAHLGIVVTAVGQGFLTAEAEVKPFLLAPNGFMHGGSVVAIADTCAGYGAIAHLPEARRASRRSSSSATTWGRRVRV